MKRLSIKVLGRKKGGKEKKRLGKREGERKSNLILSFLREGSRSWERKAPYAVCRNGILEAPGQRLLMQQSEVGLSALIRDLKNNNICRNFTVLADLFKIVILTSRKACVADWNVMLLAMSLYIFSKTPWSRLGFFFPSTSTHVCRRSAAAQ